jgi:hypothetical protein
MAPIRRPLRRGFPRSHGRPENEVVKQLDSEQLASGGEPTRGGDVFARGLHTTPLCAGALEGSRDPVLSTGGLDREANYRRRQRPSVGSGQSTQSG